MKLKHIALDRLSVSTLNMRARRAIDLANILPSVRERGVLVPLLVRPNGQDAQFEIVAGRRRYLAAKTIADETGDNPPLPCAIIEASDDAAALEASLIENFARLAPDEVTQWETFARLIREGRGVEDIATTFGITERLVQRILALGNLQPRIRSLYRQEKLDVATVRHLTMATKAQQKEWLALYDSPDGYAPTGQRLKEWLCGGELIAAKAALFDLELYKGPIVSDLFGGDRFFADPAAFWALQREAIEARRQAYLEEGWAGVELIEPGRYFHQWEHEKRPKSRGGKVYLALSHNGEVEAHEGFLPRREAARQERSENGQRAERPELTVPLRNYVDLHRQAAVRCRLVEHPGIAFRLMIAHTIAGSALWHVQPDPHRSHSPAISESVVASASEGQFDERRRAALSLLEFDAEAGTVLDAGRRRATMAVFHRLLELGEEDVAAIAAVVVGESLETGSDVVDVLGFYLNVDMASLWQPDDAFFDLLRDRQVLTALVAELAGPEAAAANTRQTGKVMKGIIRDCLLGANGREKVEGWVPKWLRFPESSYRTPAGHEPDETDDPEEVDGAEADEAGPDVKSV